MAIDLSGGESRPRPGSQVLLWLREAEERLRVAGVPLWRRAVYSACRAGFERILIVSEGPPDRLRRELEGDPRLAGRFWEVVSATDGWPERVASSGGRWVVARGDWVVEADFLAELGETAGGPAAASPDGPLAAQAEDIIHWADSGWNPRELAVVPLRAAVEKPQVYARVASAAEAELAEDQLFRSLARNANNFFARTVDRAMSRALSRRLTHTPVTPNQITIFSICLGILGSLILLHPSYAAGALGAFLFFASTVIDGCDGEIARLKFLESSYGAKLDVVGDNVVHAFLFPCLALRFYFADPSGPFLVFGAVAFAGVLASQIAVYFLIVRYPFPKALQFFELFGNREFAYLILVLALAGRLDWFVWVMTFGLWIFPLGLTALWAWERPR